MPQGQNDAVVISGCRSESSNFAWLPYLQPYIIEGCAHLSGDTEGFFYYGAGSTKISACYSRSGWVNPSSGSLEIDSACEFGAADYWRGEVPGDSNNPSFLSITPTPIIPDATTARTTAGIDNGCLVQFTSGSAITYTLGKTDGGQNRMTPGSFIDIQQMGNGQITIATASGVTVVAPTTQMTITSRAKYSTIRVTVVATNSYSISDYGITP